MGYASEKMTEAAASSGGAATASGELVASTGSVRDKIDELILMLDGLRQGHATVGGHQEAGRTAATEARTTTEQAVGPSELTAKIGAWAHMAHEGSYLQPADEKIGDIIAQLGKIMEKDCVELESLYIQEGERHLSRQEQALGFITG